MGGPGEGGEGAGAMQYVESQLGGLDEHVSAPQQEYCPEGHEVQVASRSAGYVVVPQE